MWYGQGLTKASGWNISHMRKGWKSSLAGEGKAGVGLVDHINVHKFLKAGGKENGATLF